MVHREGEDFNRADRPRNRLNMEPADSPSTRRRNRGPRTVILLNGLIVVLVVLTCYLSYAFISNAYFSGASAPADTSGSLSAKLIQLDVINGCGVKNVGAKFTDYLRNHGFDVVELKNYRPSRIPQTLVIDRVGNLEAARRVAAALGVDSECIIQQLNPDYFVDVSVLIGDDFATLPHAH
jgi:hypothetical protein